MIAYRDVTTGDSAAIARLFDASFVETFGHLYAAEDLADFRAGITAEAFEREISDPAFSLHVAEDSGKPVGFAKLGPPGLPIETPANTAELWQIYVLGPWQGRGVAARLYDWAESLARSRGAEILQLSVYVDNHRARRFYDRRGFSCVGRYDFMVGAHADEDLILRKSL